MEAISDRWHHGVLAHGRDCEHQDAHPSHGRHVGRMTVELGVGRAVGGICSAAWLGIAAHRLSVHQFGQLTLLLSLGSLVEMLTDLGIPLALTKLSCDHAELDRHAVAAAVRRRIGAGLIASLLLVVLWISSKPPERVWLAALYGVSVCVTPVTSSFLAMLRGRGIGTVEAIYGIASQLTLPLLGLGALSLGLGPAGVVVCYVAVDAMSAAVIAQVTVRRLSLTDKIDPDQEQALRLRSTMPLAAAGILGGAYERIDVFLLALLKGSNVVALYAAAYKLYDSALLPAKAVGSASVAAAGSDLLTTARRTAIRLATRAAVVTVPIAAVLGVVGPKLLRAAFGHSYRGADGALVILLVATIPGAMLAAITPIAMLARRRLVLVATTVALVGNIAANLILVPALGLPGAAWAFLLTETGLAITLLPTLPKPVVAVPPVGGQPEPLGHPVA
jgi:O-antigen/teichoic acid export membrane protein